MSDQVPSVSRCPDSAATGGCELRSTECKAESEAVSVPGAGCTSRRGPSEYLEHDDNDALTTRLQPLWDEMQRLKSRLNAFDSMLQGQMGQCERGRRDLSMQLTLLRQGLRAQHIDPLDDIGIHLAQDSEEESEAGDLSGDEAECGVAGIIGNPFMDASGSTAAEQLPLFKERLLNIRRSIEERPWPSPCPTATTPQTLEEAEFQAAEHTSLPQVGTPPVAVPQEEMLTAAEQHSPQHEKQQQEVAQPNFEEQREGTPLAPGINNKSDEKKMTAAIARDSLSEAMNRARDELRQMAVEQCLQTATDLQVVLQEVSLEVVEATLQQHKFQIEEEVQAWRKEAAAEWRQEWLEELKQDLAHLKENMNPKAELPEPCPEQACDGIDVPPHVGQMSSLASELCDLRAEAKVNADEHKLVASRVELLERQMALSREHGRCRSTTAPTPTSDNATRRAAARTSSSSAGGQRLSDRLRVRSAGRVPVPRIFCLSMPRASSPP